MTRSLPRPTISTIWLLFGACAFGFVLGVVLLVANSRPADALEIPQIDAPAIDVNGVLRDPVATVTKVAPKVPLLEAADRKAETPGPAPVTPPPVTPLPVQLPPVQLPKVQLPKVALGTVDLNQIVPLTSDQRALPTLTLPTIDLGGVDPTASNGLSVTLPSVDLGSIDPGLGGALPTITLPRADLGGVSGGHVELPSVEIPAPPSLAPTLPHTPVDLGGAARRLQAPTDAPYPLNSGGASALPPPPPPAPPGVASAGLRAVAPARAARAATTHALGSAPPSVPYDAVPADAPAAPASSAPSSPSDSGPTRAPTFLLTFAVLLATIALGHELSRRIALADQVPQSQFLTVLIERPG